MRRRVLFSFLTLACICSFTTLEARADEAVDPKLKAAFAEAKSRRIAVIALGDSNQRFGGHGWSRYMAATLGETFGAYGTDLTQYRQWQEKDGPAPAVAPDELAGRAFGYWYIAPGGKELVSWKNSIMLIPAEHPLGVSGPLRFHFNHGTFPKDENAAGTSPGFQPAVRRDEKPWSIIASAPKPLNPVTGVYGIQHYTLDVPADSARTWQVQFMPNPLKTPIEGPFFASLGHAENTARKHGIAYYTLYASGGKSLRDMILRLRALKPARADEFFGEIFRMQPSSDAPDASKARAIVMISSGLNDRNARAPSLGHAPANSSTAAGYADNLQALVTEIETIWTRNGGAAGSLHFALMVSHTLGNPEDAKLASYREAARTFAGKRPNASLIDLSKLVPYETMVSEKYYDKGRASDAHLDKRGYEAISRALAAELTK